MILADTERVFRPNLPCSLTAIVRDGYPVGITVVNTPDPPTGCQWTNTITHTATCLAAGYILLARPTEPDRARRRATENPFRRLARIPWLSP